MKMHVNTLSKIIKYANKLMKTLDPYVLVYYFLLIVVSSLFLLLL